MTRRPSLLPILLTVFIDMLGFGIVIPILAPLLIAPSSPVFGPEVPFSVRTITLGLIMGMYPLAQFFGAPILGALSDRHGRRVPLIISILGNAAGYALFAIGVMIASVPLMVISRVIAGFSGGNLAIAYSAVADMSTEKEKPRNFGLVGAMFGIGFILGPLLGAMLSSTGRLSVFGAATPFWFALGLCLINAALVYAMFGESLRKKVQVPMSLFTGIHNIKRAFSMPNIRIMFLVVFLLTFGFTAFTNFFQVFLIEKFAVTETQIGLMFGYIGLWIVFTQGGITRVVSHHAAPSAVLKIAIIGLAVSLMAILLPALPWQMYLVLPFISLFQGLILPNVTAVISDFAGEESQGEILGINQSVQSLAMAIPALAAGALAAQSPAAPMVAAAVVTFVAWIVYVFIFDAKVRSKFHEVS